MPMYITLVCYRGFAWPSTHLCSHDFSKYLGFLLHSLIWRKTTKKKTTRTFDLLHGWIWNFIGMCVLIYLSLGCNLVMCYELNKTVMVHFVAFPYTFTCKQETNMAVASMMTCKICLIWRHMKNPYSRELNTTLMTDGFCDGKTTNVASSSQRLSGPFQVAEVGGQMYDKFDACTHEWNWHINCPRIISQANWKLTIER